MGGLSAVRTQTGKNALNVNPRTQWCRQSIILRHGREAHFQAPWPPHPVDIRWRQRQVPVARGPGVAPGAQAAPSAVAVTVYPPQIAPAVSPIVADTTQITVEAPLSGIGASENVHSAASAAGSGANGAGNPEAAPANHPEITAIVSATVPVSVAAAESHQAAIPETAA